MSAARRELVDPTLVEELQQRVSETEHRFQNMADVAPVLLWMSREDGMCTFFNQTWFDFTGRTQEQEWGVGWAEGVHFEDLQRCLDTYVDAFNAREVFEMEYRLQRADGEYRWILDRGTPRYARDGTFHGYIGSCIDITERRQVETDLRRALRAKEEFLGLVSHELRTPLAALQLQLERLRREPEKAFAPRQREILDRMSVSSSRLGHLIESLLHLSRIQRGNLTPTLRNVELAELAKAIVEEARMGADKKGLALRLVAGPNLRPLLSDPDLVRLILSNLVTNAIKFTEHGFVEVSVACDQRAHRIGVKDTGRGIPRDAQARIFEPFEQLEPTRQKHTPGVGLGLSLARQMTHALGGSIALESEPDQGSVFTVTLPSVSAP